MGFLSSVVASGDRLVVPGRRLRGEASLSIAADGVVVGDRSLAWDEPAWSTGPWRRGRKYGMDVERGVAVVAGDGSRVPVRRSGYDLLEDRAMLDALLELLRGSPDARARLRSPAVVRRLAADLATPLGPAAPRPGGTAVEAALDRAGLVHRFHGRPMPGDGGPSRSDALAEVRALDPSIPDDEIAAALETYWFAVDPWPFGALLAATSE